MDAFDADVLICSLADTPAGAWVRAAMESADGRIGSVLLLPEVLSKPLRGEDELELASLSLVLSTFQLKPVDRDIADAATSFAAKYRLKAADAIHLSTAVVWGADRFHTNNRKDFGRHITEIEIVYPPSDASGIQASMTDSYAAAWNDREQSGDDAL